METNPKNLFIGFLIGIALIILWVYIPYDLKERRDLQRKKEHIDSLKYVQNPIHRPQIKEKLYQSKVKCSGYAKEVSVIHNFDGGMDIIYKDTLYIGASMSLYAQFLLDSDGLFPLRRNSFISCFFFLNKYYGHFVLNMYISSNKNQ